MQPDEQSIPPEEHEPIQYYVLEGLFPPIHVFALNLALGTFLHLYQHAQVPYPLMLGEQQLTECERDLLRPLLATYPQFTPYEMIHASFYQGYDRLSTQRITQAQQRLDLLREEKLWDAELRPIRNVMARLRLKVREVGLDTINSSRQETRQQQTQAIHIVVERHLGLVVQITKRYAMSYQGFGKAILV